MLDAFIIEEIRRREQERDDRRPRLELPLSEQPTSRQRQNDRSERDETPPRGVVIIDYSVPATS
jgi:hypothetical protein